MREGRRDKATRGFEQKENFHIHDSVAGVKCSTALVLNVSCLGLLSFFLTAYYFLITVELQ